MDPTTRTLYGRTWNANASGTLWERLWYLMPDGTGESVLCAPGVSVPVDRYVDQAELVAAFAANAAKFHGARADA
jgi:hypothetical protein